MIWADVAKVLAKLAAFDQRTVGEADMAAWHEVIGPLELEDCLAAVTVHYRESTTRAMPADIRRLARGVRDQREARERQIEGRRAIEGGKPERSPEVAKLVRDLAARLTPPEPEDESQRLRQRAQEMARQTRGRPDMDRLRRVKAPQGDTGQAAGVMSKDVETETCSLCGGIYIVDTDGQTAHRVVFGHTPILSRVSPVEE